ncbi:MAG: hypothetical protein ACRCUJ_02300 [Phocaeicola sp.]
MKKTILFLIGLACTLAAHAQIEVRNDSIHGISLEELDAIDGRFLLDMHSFTPLPPSLTAPTFNWLHMDSKESYYDFWSQSKEVSYGTENHRFNSSTYQGRWIGGGWGNGPTTWQSSSYRLKNGMRINSYGEYNADGHKVVNPAALPWERNNFNAAFEMKSANGNFGFKVEVQRGRNTPY